MFNLDNCDLENEGFTISSTNILDNLLVSTDSDHDISTTTFTATNINVTTKTMN